MKIHEYLDNMPDWGSDDRERYLRPLIPMLSGVSQATLMEHQLRHMVSGVDDYEAFVQSQNQEIATCLRLEVSETGRIVRLELGLDPLTLDTEVGIAEITVT